MTYELVLISVLIGAGYWGWFFLRNPPAGSLMFGAMQIVAALLSGLGLLGRHLESDWMGVAGAIGAGTGVCLLVVGPMVRQLARRMIAADRPRLAGLLFDLAEILVPGAGVAEEKAVVRAMAEIREGRIEQTVDALTAAKDRAPAEARLAIDERIAMLYLSAYRWTDAIAHAEAHLFDAPVELKDAESSLRLTLGVAPPVWVELLGAYGRIGDLDRAASMLTRLEEVCAGREDAALWIHRARVMFLALAGRTDAVRSLVAPRHARHMTMAARTYWVAVAHEHKGDRAAAVTAYQKARTRSRGRSRELIDLALHRLSTAAAPPAELAATAIEVVARTEAAPLPAPIRAPRRPTARGTWLLTVSLVVVWGGVTLGVGETNDTGVLVRAGAMVHDMVARGEWWRMIACVFLHVGPMHLVLNALGLLVLGRLAEELFGATRMIAIYALAGIAGSLASYAAASGMSAGASGAVFGLLGAVFVEITWHRRRYHGAWKRGMWGALAVITIGQLGYGFLYPMIDQSAHAAGLAAGALGGVMFSRHTRWSKIGRYLGAVIAIGFGAVSIAAAVKIIQTPLVDSLTLGGMVKTQIEQVSITVPASWQQIERTAGDKAKGQEPILPGAAQPDDLMALQLTRGPAEQPAAQIAAWLVTEHQWSQRNLGDTSLASDRRVPLPDGWEGKELVVLSPADDLGYRQRDRLIVCGRGFATATVLLVVRVPETVATAAPAFVAALIASTGPA